MIRNYFDIDYLEVYEMTRSYFSGEVLMDKELEEFIYKFLVIYYDYHSKYSLVYDLNGVKAFILANEYRDKNDAITYFKSEVKKLSSLNQELAFKYLDYIEYNHHKVMSFMDKDSIYLGLIVSKIHHGGLDLIKRLKEIANGKKIFLWTDETCNYGYYSHLGFKLLDTYDVKLYDKTIKTFIYQFNE